MRWTRVLGPLSSVPSVCGRMCFLPHLPLQAPALIKKSRWATFFMGLQNTAHRPAFLKLVLQRWRGWNWQLILIEECTSVREEYHLS